MKQSYSPCPIDVCKNWIGLSESHCMCVCVWVCVRVASLWFSVSPVTGKWLLPPTKTNYSSLTQISILKQEEIIEKTLWVGRW